MFAARQGVWRQHWTQSAAQNINMWPVTEMHSGPLKVWEQENEWWRRWQSFEKLILPELLPKVKHQEFNKFWLQRRRQSLRDKDENLSFIMSAVKHCGWSWLWYSVKLKGTPAFLDEMRRKGTVGISSPTGSQKLHRILQWILTSTKKHYIFLPPSVPTLCTFSIIFLPESTDVLFIPWSPYNDIFSFSW